MRGFAHGWEGAAWVRLQRGDLDGRFVGWIARKLDESASERESLGPSHLIGCGAAAIVALLAAEHAPELASRAAAHVARWAASTCSEADDDVMLGHPGALLALSELADACPSFRPPRALLRRAQTRTRAALRRILADGNAKLGLAHGIAGLVLADACAVRLGARRDDRLHARAIARLAAARAIAPGYGTVWMSSCGDDARFVHSWCHGAPGIVLALAGVYALTGSAEAYALADEATPSIAAIASPSQTLCCGRSGRAQILIELYRLTGRRSHLSAAQRVLAEPAPPKLSRDHRRGLFQGSLGVAYTAARLADPRRLALPGTGFASACA